MISAVVLTKNEEKNIKECLEGIKWCDEIIIIDDNSKDKTVKIAKESGAKVFNHSLNNDFSAQRNYGLSKVKGDWILFVDADERISEPLQYEIRNVILFEERRDIDGYFIKRKDFMWGKELKHGEAGNIKLLRLAKKGKGEWIGKAHETWKVKGKTKFLKNSILHYPHQDVKIFLEEINFYTNLRAEELIDKKVKISWFSIILYPIGKFIINFFVKRGFMDGTPGFIIAMTMSFHSFMARSKTWLRMKNG